MLDLTLTAGSPADGIVRFQFGPSMGHSLPSTALQLALNDDGVHTVWHEAGHAFMRPTIARNATRIDALNRRFDGENAALKRQNIATWEYAFEENVVRAVVAVLIGDASGADAMHAECRLQAADGFAWVPTISELLARELVAHRDMYPTLDAFTDRLLALLATRKSVSDAAVVP